MVSRDLVATIFKLNFVKPVLYNYVVVLSDKFDPLPFKLLLTYSQAYRQLDWFSFKYLNTIRIAKVLTIFTWLKL